MEVVIGLFLYITPLAILPFILKDSSVLRRLAVITCLTGSLVGELTLVIASRRYEFSSLFNPNFWSFLVVFYPVAVFPLGFWVGLLAVWGYQLAKTIRIRHKVAKHTLYLLGIVLGAVIGSSFVAIYIGIAVLGGVSQYPHEGIGPYLLAGFLTGGLMGPLSVKFVYSDTQLGEQTGAT